jgi:uncharacterized protein (TIGR01370 family)
VTLFNSYALQFSNATATSLANTGAELLITESALTSANATPALTTAELAALAAAGKIVVAYVNTSVTDAARSYWNNDWVTPTDPSEPDVGTINEGAPDWLVNNLGGVDFAPEPPGQPPADEAILVDYRNADWRALVISQAVTQVEAGYGGVFLDDVAQYFAAGNRTVPFDTSFTDAMMQLVIDVAAAVRAVNPDAKIIVNAGIFIGSDSTEGSLGELFTAYRAAIDGMIIETQFETEANGPGTLSAALSNFPGISIMALESLARGVDPGKLLEFAANNPGLLPYIVPDEAYDSFVRTPLVGTAGDDTLLGAASFANLVGGGDGNDSLTGRELNDTLYGHDGNDNLRGNAGNDSQYGGAGNDSLNGGSGTDRLFGGTENDRLIGDADADTLQGGSGNDVLYGGTGNDILSGGLDDDRLFGGADADRLQGGAGNDTLDGGTGSDQFVFDLMNGNDRVTAFEQGSDRLNLRAFDVSFAEARAALQVTGAGILLDLADLGGTGTVLLVGQTSLADFTARDFIL